MMSGSNVPPSQETQDLGEYCRRIEEHLARINQGHLIRIAGTSFELVRAWARAGIPIAVVFRGIERKAERHRAGTSKRPLRLEFCDGDVQALFDDWRRAVGLPAGAAGGSGTEAATPPALAERRRPSAVREIDRAVNRLVAAAGRLDTPESLRESLADVLERLATIREELRHARGDARKVLIDRVAEVDRRVGDAARRAAGSALAEVESEGAAELAAYRTRLSSAAWQRSLDRAVDRLLRQRYGLPSIDLPETVEE